MNRLTKGQLLAYGAPELGTKAMSYPTLIALPAFYATYTDATLAQIGLVLIFVRIFDAVTDPIVGFLSDRTRSRFGRRKPWMAAGAVMGVASAYFLYNPAPDDGVAYFALWMSALFLAWTFITVPHFTWASELASDYNERSRIVAYRGVFSELGQLTFLVVPFLPLVNRGGYNSQTFEILTGVLCILLPLGVGVALARVPQGEARPALTTGIYRDIGAIFSNRLFLHFLAIFAFAGTAIGITLATLVLFVGGYIGTPDKAPVILLAGNALSLLAYPIWMRLCARWNKQFAWAVGFGLQAIVMGALTLLVPGPQSYLLFLTLFVLNNFVYTVHAIVPTSILADVIDYDLFKTGQQRAGVYFSVYMFFYKAVVAIGSGVSFLLLDYWGFDAKGETTAAGLDALLNVHVGIPLFLNLVAIFLMLSFPMTRGHHRALRTRIERRSSLPDVPEFAPTAPVSSRPAS